MEEIVITGRHIDEWETCLRLRPLGGENKHVIQPWGVHAPICNQSDVSKNGVPRGPMKPFGVWGRCLAIAMGWTVDCCEAVSALYPMPFLLLSCFHRSQRLRPSRLDSSWIQGKRWTRNLWWATPQHINQQPPDLLLNNRAESSGIRFSGPTLLFIYFTRHTAFLWIPFQSQPPLRPSVLHASS